METSPQDQAQKIDSLVGALPELQDDRKTFDETVIQALDAAIERGEILLTTSRYVERDYPRHRPTAYEVAASGLLNSVPRKVRREFLGVAGWRLKEVAEDEAADKEAQSWKKKYQKFGKALIETLKDDDDMLLITHPKPAHIDYINEEEAERDPDDPEIGDPIPPEKIRENLVKEAQEIISRFQTQATEAQDKIIKFSKQSLEELRAAGLEEIDARDIERIVGELAAGNLSRALSIGHDFVGLTRHQIFEIFNEHLLRESKTYINQGKHQKAIKLNEVHGSEADSSITDVLDSLILRDANNLMISGRDSDALAMVEVNASEGSKPAMIKVLSPHALKLAEAAIERGAEQLARDLIERFFPNSVEKSKVMEALSLESE